MMPSAPLHRSFGRLIARLLPVAAGLAAACTEGQLAGPASGGLTAPPVSTRALATLDCTVNVRSRAVSCASEGPASGGGASRDVVYGGQNSYIVLAQSSFTYDGADELLESNITITNKLRDLLATKDLVTLDTAGIKVFFTELPTTTGGTGVVTLHNADGTATFTAAGQPYFKYGQILAQNQTSVPKAWQFDLPATVTSFSFKVAIATVVAPRLVITEIMANPASVADDQGEYFEVYNAGVEAVDMTGWKFASRSGTTVPTVYDPIQTVPGSANVIVPVGGCRLFAVNANSSGNGGLLAVAWGYASAMALGNTNPDFLVLRTPANAQMDSVSYTSVSAASGASRILRNINSDNSTMGDTAWVTPVAPKFVTGSSGDRGTPCGNPSGNNEYPAIGGFSNATGSSGPTAGPITQVAVSPNPASTANGTTLQFSAVARDAANVIATTTFTWTSSNTAVATINASTGLATTVSEGTTTITATAPNTVAGTSQLTVSAPGTPDSVNVTPNNTPADVPVGFTRPYFYTVRDGANTVITPAPAVTWSSSNEAVITVDQLGYATGVGVGTAEVIATTSNGVSDGSTITVIPATAATTAVYRNHIEFGTPFDADGSDDLILTKSQYVLSYNAARGGPNWVSWDLNATHFGSQDRCNCFSADPALPGSVYHVVDFDYRNGGYDRGHMVMSFERTTTSQENAATFLFTNILPQAADNNQGPWLNFENYLNTLAQTGGKEVYVISGGQYGPTPPSLKNEGKVQIPEYTWKIALVMNAGQTLANVSSASDVRVIAVRMPNFTAAHASPGDPRYGVMAHSTPWQNFKTTVASIQAATGYNFLDLLPDSVETVVEATVDP